MERFFYQAWKQEGLPLPPGAGPALSRARSGRGQTSTSGRQQEVDQHDTKHDQRRHAHTYEVTLLAMCSLWLWKVCNDIQLLCECAASCVNTCTESCLATYLIMVHDTLLNVV